MGLPFQLKRLILNYFFDFEIDRSAKMGVSWVYPKKLSMSSGAYIGHLNIIKNIELLEMGEGARVGHQNTVTCAEKGATRSFAEVERATVLSVGRGACITRKHYLDCTDRISIGNFVTVAGFNSQFLTHSIDVYGNKQSCESISIAEYSLLGTNSVVLPGSYLPSKVVVGVSSLLNKNKGKKRK